MTFMNEKNRADALCFTGHRDINYFTYHKIPKILKPKLEEYIAKGIFRFRAGGAVGFDTIAALCVLDLKKKYPHIKLELILPCRDQDKYFRDLDKKVYAKILKKADLVEYIGERYTSGCMHARNRALVNESSVCIAYCNDSKGGTAYTMSYALSHGLEVVNIHDLMK